MQLGGPGTAPGSCGRAPARVSAAGHQQKQTHQRNAMHGTSRGSGNENRRSEQRHHTTTSLVRRIAQSKTPHVPETLTRGSGNQADAPTELEMFVELTAT
jgi:hypothetical protein